MESEPQNMTVVVTGAALGIGYAITEAFLKNGARRVLLLDINVKEGSESADKLNTKYGENKAIFIKCDVTRDLDAVFDGIITKFKSVDVLVNNAGVVNENSVRKTIEVNTIATMEFTMKFWEHMRKDEGGSGGTIINIASVYGIHIDPFLPFYKASKFAVVGFSQSMGDKLNYNKTGVRVLVLCPGFTRTGLAEGINVNDRMIYQEEEIKTFLMASKWQEAADVADAAVNIFKMAESGTAWVIEGAKPVAEHRHNKLTCL